jgi:diadenosine tetraphosphate (Ap4A) HIT family hydrolase
VYILENWILKVKKVVKALSFTFQEKYMKENLNQISNTERDTNAIQMAPSTPGNFLMGPNRDEAFLNGAMEKSMKDNGKVVKKVEVVCGKAPMDNPTLVNGKMERFKVSEYTLWQMARDMKVSLEIL